MIPHRALMARVVFGVWLLLGGCLAVTTGYVLWHAPRPVMQEASR
jgi:hypothetical protein